ncbi:MAG: hypothetical protein AB8B65_00945 [Kordia sp.]|uniref:hypothetical protein n=1 Tax=Kordia sp. TaxID=1965332 RepID=UPI003859B5EE
MKQILKFSHCLLLSLLMYNCSETKTDYKPINLVSDTSMAASNTDQYIWEKMVRIFQTKTESPLNLNWEFWASAEHTYANACEKSEWPGDKIQKFLGNPKAVAEIDSINNQRIDSVSNFETSAFTLLTLNFDNPYYEELRINKAMFDYIQDNALYNQDSVYKMAKEGKINFPKDAMMIKAQWIPVDSSQVGSYYTKIISGKKTVVSKVQEAIDTPNYVDASVTNKLMGLVGFHIVTHELPNWVWATFEYSGNVGICDYIGCKDDFGCTESYIAPNPDNVVNKGYNTGETSKALNLLFEENNVPEVFKNYRLKGSQTQYTDNEGQPTILGNSILEANLVSSSSCISCHARATLNNLNPAKRQSLGMFSDMGGDAILPGEETDTTTVGYHPVAINGKPILKDYKYNSVTPDSTYYRTNFMWQLAQRAGVCDEE